MPRSVAKKTIKIMSGDDDVKKLMRGNILVIYGDFNELDYARDFNELDYARLYFKRQFSN